jgi:hypothetical protein
MSENLDVVDWPNRPARPTLGKPVLVRVYLALPRWIARQQLRLVARMLIAAWSDGIVLDSAWHERPQGPVCEALLDGQSVFLSFSYTENFGWIAFSIERAVGIDALHHQAFAELESVARLYFSPAKAKAVLDAENPVYVFAQAWTAREARLKLYGRNLVEFPDLPSDGLGLCEYSLDHCGTVVTLVTDYPLPSDLLTSNKRPA